MNFGFVENSSVDCSFEQSSELSFFVEHYETSDLAMYENDAIKSYTIENNVKPIIITSPTRSVIVDNHYYNYSNLTFVKSTGDDSGEYYLDDPNLNYNDIWNYDNSSLANISPYSNKGGGNSPFTLHYMIPNSKVNRQVPRLYTSGFV